MDSDAKEKLLYLLRFTDYYIENLVYDVLDDSEEDPHYSAVTATNLIRCYIDVMGCFDSELPYKDVDDYLKDNCCLSSKELKKFKASMEKEKTYYVGKIYE